METLLRRTTYIIKNIEKTIHFYKNVIGLNLLWQTETTLNGNLPIGSPGDKAKFVAFNGVDPVVGMVAFMELIQNQEPPKDTINTAPKKLDLGNSILVIGVENCEEVYKKLNSINANIHKKPFDNFVTDRNGKRLKMISMLAWDPNNIFLEINQRMQ